MQFRRLFYNSFNDNLSKMSAIKQKNHKQSDTIQEQPSAVSQKYLALSFALPFIIMGAIFAFHKVFPFGNMMILISDFWGQYYPFLSSLWHKLRDGSAAAWSWTASAGHNYAAHIAYYAASPLNLLALMMPHAWLREMLTLTLLVKLGCAGLFTAVFLRATFKQNGPCLAVFSSLYALCAFTLGYYWNIIWFDTFALLPLVTLGLLSLLHDGKWRLYAVSLALAVFINFYMGFFICVFTAISFLSVSVIQKFDARKFASKIGAIAACSALALGMTAALTIPAFTALQSTNSVTAPFPSALFLYRSFFSVIGNFIAFNEPTNILGLPNLYCGMVSLLLAGAFIASPKISLREKLVHLVIIVFLVLSCNINALDYIMHGFRYTNAIPFRFSFLISFILVIMAYRAFLLIKTDGVKKRDIIIMIITAALFLLSALLGSQEKISIIGSAVLSAVYMLLFYLFSAAETPKKRTVMQSLLFLVIITELSVTAWIGIDKAGTINRDNYPDRNTEIQAMLNQRSSPDQPVKDFYRTEIIPYLTENDSSLYNYNGVSFFSSMVDDNVSRFFWGLGLIGGGRAKIFIGYNMTSPLPSTFLAMRYLIIIGDAPPDTGINWEVSGKIRDTMLLENKFHLPLGFMANKELSDFAHNASNPFKSQNDLFRLATGLDGDLFMAINSAVKTDTSTDYKMLSDDMLYVYFSNTIDDILDVLVNGDYIGEIHVTRNMPCIFIIDSFSKGDIISFKSQKKTQTNAAYLNSALFEQGYVLLADEPLNLTHFSETKVRGNVTALQDGILYTSIPGRNWNVYVDGVKSELLLIDNAMAAVRLNAGTHEVEFRYLNKSFVAGVIISIVSLAVFAVMIIVDIRKRRKQEKE